MVEMDLHGGISNMLVRIIGGDIQKDVRIWMKKEFYITLLSFSFGKNQMKR